MEIISEAVCWVLKTRKTFVRRMKFSKTDIKERIILQSSSEE